MNYHHDNHLPGAKAMESQSILNMKIFIMRMSQHEYFHYEKILPLKMSCFRMKQFPKTRKKCIHHENHNEKTSNSFTICISLNQISGF